MAAALLGPEVNHLAREVEGVSHHGSETEANAHVNSLAPVVAEVLVDPEEEELVLQPRIESHVAGPEDKGTCPDREAALEQVAGTLLEGDPDERVNGRGISSAEL